jgi:hypothetical protein
MIKVILNRSIPHGREHSIQWLARELNVDRLSLAGRLLGGRASEVEAKRKFTVAEAFETWTARSEGEESRNRKVKAEAEAAEDGRRAKGSPNRAFQPGRPKSSLFFSCF